jgi:hypothetical protein
MAVHEIGGAGLDQDLREIAPLAFDLVAPVAAPVHRDDHEVAMPTPRHDARGHTLGDRRADRLDEIHARTCCGSGPRGWHAAARRGDAVDQQPSPSRKRHGRGLCSFVRVVARPGPGQAGRLQRGQGFAQPCATPVE